MKRGRGWRVAIVALAAGGTVLAAEAAAAEGTPAVKTPHIHHVPEVIGPGVRGIYPSAQENNHVLIVNVGGAIPAEDFAAAVTYAMSRINLNAWTNSIGESVVAELIERPERQKELFGEKAAVAVFLERREGGAGFLDAPGSWAMANVWGLDRDNPSGQTLKDRYAKTILRGVGYACGVGANIDELCSLNYRGSTLEGMDATDIRLSPMAYFPMLAILQSIGGMEMTMPPRE